MWRRFPFQGDRHSAGIALRAGVVLAAVLASAPPLRAEITEVEIGAGQIDPGRGQGVDITFRAEPDASARVVVYDPDGGLVRELAAGAGDDPTRYAARWDGLDLDGRIVPDEAYTFVVHAGDEVHDPTVTSGGVVGDVTDVRFAPDAFNFRLEQPSRVLIRIGIRGGPMHRTLVDWKPRIAGAIREAWDGRDESGLLDLRGVAGFSALVTYVTLPDATVITYGNDDESYRAYKLGRAEGRPRKPDRERIVSPGERLRPRGLVPPAWSRAPRVVLTFIDEGLPRDEQGTPLVGEQVRTRIDVESEDRAALEGDQFEVILFADGELVAEAERGYLPLTWRWDLGRLSPGEHVLTVNISSFGGQVGVASRRIRLVD